MVHRLRAYPLSDAGAMPPPPSLRRLRGLRRLPGAKPPSGPDAAYAHEPSTLHPRLPRQRHRCPKAFTGEVSSPSSTHQVDVRRSLIRQLSRRQPPPEPSSQAHLAPGQGYALVRPRYPKPHQRPAAQLGRPHPLRQSAPPRAPHPGFSPGRLPGLRFR